MTWTDKLHQPSPLPRGTRIRLVSMPRDPDPIEPGAVGTVTGGNGAQMRVRWDNGRSLLLLPDTDVWEVLNPCGCMTEEDPLSGDEKVMTHSSTCHLHPECDA